jgi:hypothetical protein
MDYMTISEAATKWNLSNRRIQTLCSQGRIPGAERAGYCWLLPKDAEYLPLYFPNEIGHRLPVPCSGGETATA